MNPKERLANAMQGRLTDRPPCICPGGMMNMVTLELMEAVGTYLPEAHTDAKKMADLAAAVYKEGCFENYGVPFCMTVEAEELGAGVDLGTNIYEPHVTRYVLDSVEEWSELPKMTCESGRSSVVLEAIQILKARQSDVPIIGNLTGPVSTASSLIEPVIFYKELRKKNKKAHEYLNFITEQLIHFGKKQIETGADVIAISDPSGTGEILGPKLFEEFAVTYINRLIDGLKPQKTGVIVHICGKMSSVYKEVNHLNSHVLSFDSIVPIKEAKSNLEGRILMGNVSTYALEFGETEKVKSLTRNCRNSGSNILSPACGLGMKSPLTNVRAILECLTEESKYAQD